MLSEELVDIATRHQVYLERLKAGEIAKTDVLFKALGERLMATLIKVQDANLGILTSIEAAALIADVRKGHVEEYQKHLNRIVAFLFELAEFEREHEIEALNNVLADTVEVADEEDDGLWAFVTGRPLGVTGALLAAWLGSWMTNEVTRAENITRRAIAEGWTVSGLSTAFKGTKAGNYADGLFGSAKRNTKTTINTAVQHVSTAARVRTMEQAEIRPKGFSKQGDAPKTDKEGNVTSIPVKARAAAIKAGITVGSNVKLLGYRWVSILDNATTQICRSLDQQVFRFGEGPLPPAHGNCRSSIVAEIIGRWLKRGPKGQFVKKDERRAQGAKGAEPVDGKLSYYQWLKTQPDYFQDDALGVTRAALFRKGGLSAESFAKLNLGRNFKPLTLEEMRRLKPNAFKRAGL